MEQNIRIVSKDLLCLIPKFEGEQSLLNLFLKKAQYVYSGFASHEPAQQTYVFHAITSRLHGRAAALISERDDISTWSTLREVLIQHFGDPRSEDCIAIELEQMKINSGESYIDFCHRIQHMRSTLFAKVNLISDEGVKAAKMIVYNNLSLNVFLYNLTEDLIRIVRLKGCTNLEAALSIVTEEVNFINQFNAKQKQRQISTPPKPLLMPNPGNNPINGFKFGNAPFNSQIKPIMPASNFKFGIPQSQPQGFRFGVQPQNAPSGFRPNQNSGLQNFKFGQPRPHGFNFGIPPQGQGFRMPMNPNFARPPMQQFGQPQQKFNFGVPNQNLPRPKLENTDVSMRTARPLRQNMLTSGNEQENVLFYNNEIMEASEEQGYEPNVSQNEEYYNYNMSMPETQTYSYEAAAEDYEDPNDNANFQIEASNFHLK